MGIKKRREFRFGCSSLAFNWIEQKVLTRDSQSLVIERRDKAKSFSQEMKRNDKMGIETNRGKLDLGLLCWLMLWNERTSLMRKLRDK
jgi:hypothetical protein